MVKLQTEIPLKPERNTIDYSSSILLLGSCFVENIGAKMDFVKLNNLQNPFGIVYHPLAIEKLITRSINEEPFTEDDIFYYQEQWHCFEVHSTLSHPDKKVFLDTLNKLVHSTSAFLNRATHLIITYGTAWAYRFIESDQYVANCHKVPQKKFLKELLPVTEIQASIERILVLLKMFNPSLQTVFTISPVRHIKDGMVENTISKSNLIAGLHAAIGSGTKARYFPSYEIVMDQLRDYRFYKEDLLHPNTTAITIIWDAFTYSWLHDKAKEVALEVVKIQQALLHRPIHPDSEAHKVFKDKLNERITSFLKQHPYLDF